MGILENKRNFATELAKDNSLKILFVFGTRPESIKMAPLIKACSQDDYFTVKVCVTGQHRQMLDQVLEFFSIIPDFDLNVMRSNQTLFDITSESLKLLEPVLDDFRPDLIFVQGDTTTAFVGALAGYYSKISVAHIEAGLRTGNLLSPFPEEGNRKLISQLTKYHFAPTPLASNNLASEGINTGVFEVGNTVIDALLLGMDLIRTNGDQGFSSTFGDIDFSKKIILVTGHRRESFGLPFSNIFEAIRELAEKFQEQIEIVYPVHLNPKVRTPANEILRCVKNVHLIEPLSYPNLIWLMNRSYLVLTDSGGIQEEAPSLGKPVLVTRDVTERQEGVDAGTAKLIGTNKGIIVKEVERLLNDQDAYTAMAQAINPYGDGKASKRIIQILKNEQRT